MVDSSDALDTQVRTYATKGFLRSLLSSGARRFFIHEYGNDDRNVFPVGIVLVFYSSLYFRKFHAVLS